jgi:hypothetical protein
MSNKKHWTDRVKELTDEQLLSYFKTAQFFKGDAVVAMRLIEIEAEIGRRGLSIPLKFEISEDPAVNKFLNEKNMIPFNHNITKLLNEFAQWYREEISK